MAKVDERALRMAEQIVDGLTSEWRPQAFHDTYAEELRKRIKAKDAGEEVVEEEPAEATPAKVVDLMAALEASVEKAPAADRRPARGSRKSA